MVIPPINDRSAAQPRSSDHFFPRGQQGITLSADPETCVPNISRSVPSYSNASLLFNVQSDRNIKKKHLKITPTSVGLTNLVPKIQSFVF